MGFFQKLKDFGSKVVKGVRKGYEFVRDKVAPVISKVWQPAKAAITAINPAAGTAMNTVEGIYNKVAPHVKRIMGD